MKRKKDIQAPHSDTNSTSAVVPSQQQILIYPDFLNPLDTPVIMSPHPTHSAPQITFYSNYIISNSNGYRQSKASHGVFEGFWYFEVLILPHSGNLRIGWSQISGDLQAPCGYDEFSYSFRDSPGTLFHKSRSVEPSSALYSQGYSCGDTIGISIYLPPLTFDNSNELESRMWNPETMKDYLPIRANPLNPILSSEIRYYRNGVDLGIAFRDINFGKYYPAISSYMGGKVSVNFGPDFKHHPPEGAIAYHHAQNVVFPIKTPFKSNSNFKKSEPQNEDEIIKQEKDENSKKSFTISANNLIIKIQPQDIEMNDV